MRTKCKKYKIRIHFTDPIPGIADNGIYESSTVAKSLQGAEKYAKQHAKIFGSVGTATHCEIEYKKQTGTVMHKVLL